MNASKWRHYRGEIILGCVRWYCRYGISYRELEEMMLERGIKVDHTMLYRWVQHYAPGMKRRLHYFWKPSLGYKLASGQNIYQSERPMGLSLSSY